MLQPTATACERRAGLRSWQRRLNVLLQALGEAPSLRARQGRGASAASNAAGETAAVQTHHRTVSREMH